MNQIFLAFVNLVGDGPHLEEQVLVVNACPQRLQILPGDVLGAARDVDEHGLEVVEHPRQLQVAVFLGGRAVEPAGGDQVVGRRALEINFRGPASGAFISSTSSISVCWK